MAQTIKLKRSATAGAIPSTSDLALGEIAINTADGAVYIKKGNDDIVAVHDNDILHIDTSNGRVGIGTTSPTEKLTIVGNTFLSGDNRHVYFGGSNTFIGERSNSTHLELRGGGSSAAQTVYIDNNGKVGIGTSSPSYLLHIDNVGGGDGIALQDTNDAGSTGLHFLNNSGTIVAEVSGLSDNTGMTFETAGSERMRIDASGNLIVGGTTAQQTSAVTLTAGGSIINDGFIKPATDASYDIGSSSKRYQDLYLSGTANVNGVTTNANTRVQASSGMLFLNGPSAVTFEVGAGSEKMRLTSTGLGIGTNSPTAPLSIGGTGSLGAISNNYQIATSIDGGYSTTNARQHKVIGFIGTTAGITDIYDSTYASGERSKNFYTGLFTENSYFNASSYRIVQGGKSRLTIKQDGEFVINEDSIDRDFRVESDNNTHALFVQGSDGNIGIGESSPDGKLHIKGGTATGDASHVLFENTQGSKVFAIGGGASGVTNNNLFFRNVTDNTTPMAITDAGDIQIGGTTVIDSSRNFTNVNSIKLDDSKIAYFGTGNDLQIYHDGNNSNYIKSTTSDIYLRNEGDNDKIYIQATNSGTLANYLTIDGGDQQIKVAKTLKFYDDVQAWLGNSNDLRIYHNGTTSNSNIENYTGGLYITNYADDQDIIFRSDDGSGGVTNYIQIDGSEGRTLFNKHIRVNDGVQVQVGSSNDMHLYHNGTNSFIKNTTNDLYILNEADGKDIMFQADNGSGGNATYFQLDGSQQQMKAHKNIVFFDDVGAYFGGGADLRIYHDGSNSHIKNIGTGSLYIAAEGTGDLFLRGEDDIFIQPQGGENGIVVQGNGAVTLYHDASSKLQTTSTGIDVTGSITTDGLTTSADINFGDDDKALFGAGNDLKIYHSANNHSYIHEVGSGDLNILATNIKLQDAGGSTKLATTSAGINVTGEISGVTAIRHANSNAQVIDNDNDTYFIINDPEGINRILIGDSGDRTTMFRNDTFRFQLADGTEKIRMTSTGRVGIGTTNPTTILHIRGAAGDPAKLAISEGGAESRIYTTRNSDDNGDLRFQTEIGGTIADRLRIDYSGNTIVSGNLTVQGTTTTLNTATLDVEDKNITLNYGSGDTSGSADGAGITIQDAVDASNNATMLWDASNDEFDFSHPITVTSYGTQLAAGHLRFKFNGGAYIDNNTTGQSLNFRVSNSSSLDTTALTINSTGQLLATPLGVSTPSFAFTNDTNTGMTRPTGDTLQLVTGGVERVRIDSSGNLLVGTTDSSPWNNSAGTSADNGIALRPDGILSAARNGGTVALFNRTSSDGDVIQVLKNGTTVGSIGANSDALYISSPYGNDSGLRFVSGIIAPATTTGANRDAAIDLGYSSGRFKDLHLSGTAYTGGSFSAGATGDSVFFAEGSQHIFRRGSAGSYAEFGRFNSSGHFLVATTNASNTVAGFRAYSGGNIGSAINGQCAELNRLSSNGSILGFQKDGTTVGTIGVDSTDNLYIAGGSGSTKGLYFNDAGVLPATTGGGVVNNAVDLGQSGYKFKNLYLSGTISSGAITASGLSYLTQVDSSEFRNTTRVSNATTPANTAGWFKIAKVVRGGGRILLSFTGGSYTPDTYVIDYYRNWSGVGSLFLKKYQGTSFITKARIRQDSGDSNYYVEIYCASNSNGLSFQVYHQRLQGFANDGNTVYGGSLSAGATSGTDIVSEQSFISKGIWTEAIEADYYHGNVNISSGNLKFNGTTVIDSSRNIVGAGSISNINMIGASTYLPGHAYSNTHDGTNVYWHIGSASGSTNKNLRLRIYNSSNSYVTNTWSPSGLSIAGSLTTTGNITSTGFITTADHVKATGNNLKFHAGGTHVLNIDLNGKIYPETDAVYDLGFAGSRRFRHAYFTQSVNAGSFVATGSLKLNPDVGNDVEIAADGSYGTSGSGRYVTIGFGGTSNGSNRIFAHNTGEDGLFLASATSRDIIFRTGGTTGNTFRMTSGGAFQVLNTTILDASRNLQNIASISSGAITSTSTIQGIGIKHSNTNEVIELNDNTYTILRNPEGSNTLYMGDSADRGNYYDNNHHNFRPAGGGTAWARILSSGINIQSGGLQINGTTVIDASRALTSINHITTGGLVKINASGSTSSSIKLLVGTTNSSSSSAIAQFGGFLRARDYIFLHDSSTLTNAVRLGYNGGHIDLTGGEGSNTVPATRVNSIASPDGTQLVFPNNSGKVGIGVAAPSSMLHVVSNDSTTNNAVNMMILTASSTGTTTTGFGPAILLQGERNNGVNQNVGRIRSVAEVNSGTNISSALAFETSVAGVLNERVRISYDGKVGIGTTSPTHLLHVNGTTATILAQSTSAGANASIWFNSNVGGTQANRWEVGTNISAGSSFEVYDRVNNASRMVINSSGNSTFSGTISSGAITTTGHIQQNNGYEIRSKDTGGTVRTIMRVNSSNELEYGWSGNGKVKIMGGGSYTERFSIGTDGNATFSGNLYIANQIIHSGDTNTWMSFETDTISFRTGGTDRVVINNSEMTTKDMNVGGTGNASIKVRHIEGKASDSANYGGLFLNYNSTSNVQIGHSSNLNDLFIFGALRTGNSLRLDNGGNLHNIGTVDATYFDSNSTEFTSTRPIKVYHEGGNSAVSGGIFLEAHYSGDDILGSLSSSYSSGVPMFGSGMAYKAGASGIVSTFDNFSGKRSGIKVNRGEIRFTGTSGAVQTTVGSALTVVDTFIHDTADGDTTITGSMSIGDLSIGNTTVINGARALTNIASANVAGNITVDYTGNGTNDAGIFIQNDNNDWGLRIHKTGTNTHGMQIDADGPHVFRTVNSSGTEKFRIDGDGDIETVRNITSTGAITSSSNITAGNSSNNGYVQANLASSGGTMTLYGYGLEMNRSASYIRPSSDNTNTLYFGSTDASLDWNAIYFRSTNGLYITGTQFLTTDRNLVNIGTISSGAITSSGDVVAYSDERLKSNIQTLDGKKALQMRGVSFEKDGIQSSGVIAQEIEKIAPELVHTSDDEMKTKSVAYGNLVGYLIEAVKEQQEQIKELQEQVQDLTRQK